MHDHIAFLKSFSGVSKENIAELLKISKFQKIEARDIIVDAGVRPSKVYFLVSGIIRSYITLKGGKEYNKDLYFPSCLLGSLTALFNKAPSLFTFEALSDCEVYEVDFCKLMVLCDENTKIKDLYYKALQRVYINSEKRQVDLLTLNATKRYLNLKKEIPHIDLLLHKYQIASYLGITPVSFSRIIKKIHKGF